MTPIRRLEGVAYWVIEEPDDIGDFVRTSLRREWEADLRGEGKDPASDSWLAGLPGRRWALRVLGVEEIRTESEYMNSARLAERRRELRRAIEVYGAVIWPVVVQGKGNLLVDGFCRFTTLRELGVPRVYAYVSSA